MNKKAIIIVLDGVGIGELPDAAARRQRGRYAGTYHQHSPSGTAEHGLGLANIDGAGFSGAVDAPKGLLRQAARGFRRQGYDDRTLGNCGHSAGACVPDVPERLPQDFIEKYEKAIGRGTIGNKAASGTTILDELGEEHLKTGKLIVYTSADSVFQIAANEAIVPLNDLYRYCEIARGMLKRRAGSRPRDCASVRWRSRRRVQAHGQSPRFQRHAAENDVRCASAERTHGLRRRQD